MSLKDDDARKAYHRDYWAKNKHKYAEQQKRNAVAQRERTRKLIREAKAKPCADCGVEYPYYVMQFDHVNDDKEANIAHLISCSTTRIQAEIAKCEVVCANCHMERTHQRWLRNRDSNPNSEFQGLLSCR